MSLAGVAGASGSGGAVMPLSGVLNQPFQENAAPCAETKAAPAFADAALAQPGSQTDQPNTISGR